MGHLTCLCGREQNAQENRGRRYCGSSPCQVACVTRVKEGLNPGKSLSLRTYSDSTGTEAQGLSQGSPSSDELLPGFSLAQCSPCWFNTRFAHTVQLPGLRADQSEEPQVITAHSAPPTAVNPSLDQTKPTLSLSLGSQPGPPS